MKKKIRLDKVVVAVHRLKPTRLVTIAGDLIVGGDDSLVANPRSRERDPIYLQHSALP
jgi:hypothetical protein